MTPMGKMIWESHHEPSPGAGCPRCRYLIKHCEAMADELWCSKCSHFHRERACPVILPAEKAASV